MKLTLNSITHSFRSLPEQIKVVLALESDDLDNIDSGLITVIIKHSSPKSLTLDQIETLAIEQAKSLMK